MPDFENIKRKAQSAAYTVVELAQGVAAVTAEKAGELKRYAEVRAALASEKRNLSKKYRALGEWYAARCVEDVPEEIAEVVGAIRASQAKIEELNARAGEAACQKAPEAAEPTEQAAEETVKDGGAAAE